MKKLGYKPHAVDNAARLTEALKSGQYDVVLGDLAEAANVQRQVASSTPRTVVVPVVFKRAKAEETAAARQKLALDIDVNHVTSRYEGHITVPPHGPVDTRFYHPTFQDARIAVHTTFSTTLWS